MSGSADTSGAFQAVLRSFELFATAPVIATRCVYAVAVNTTMADLEEFKAAFEHCDRDGDGMVSRGDLYSALYSAQAMNIVDPYALFAAADVDNGGYLDFRKFAAVCLYERLAPLDDWLAKQAFVSLDSDADGWLSAQDVFKMFGFVPAGLPAFRQFNLQEWTMSLQPTMQGQSTGASQPQLVELDNPVHDDGKQQCGMGLVRGGLLSGCLKKRSHRRQASAFEAVDENMASMWPVPQDDFAMGNMYPTNQPIYSPSTCGQQAWMLNQQHAHGMGLSSPSYAPVAHY
eukprot:TRINITY_DN3323_c0_g1_i3.p2 TRINITY_DN3323_c0_g1~~TRINITY_DN3323_c0_g1_i3.p2  ORF type:complete len:319 (+),score=87.60 TRINITY_DN3323_c0_g1_i3:99-959(+)